MAWTFRFQNGANDNGAGHIIISTAGYVPGDLMFAIVCDTSAVGTAAVGAPTPSGWTQIQAISKSYITTRIYWKIAAAEPASYDWPVTTVLSGATGAILGYYDPTQSSVPQLDSSSSHSGAAGTSHTATGGMFSIQTNLLVLAAFGLGRTSGNAWTPPAGMTERVDRSVANHASIEVSDVTATGPTLIPDKTATSTKSAASHDFLAVFYYPPSSGGGSGGGSSNPSLPTIPRLGPVIMDDSIANTTVLAGVEGPVRLRFRYERRDRFNRFIEDITQAIVGKPVLNLNNERAILQTLRNVTIDTQLLPSTFDIRNDRVAVFCDVYVPGSNTPSPPLGPNYFDALRSLNPQGYWRLGEKSGTAMFDSGVNLLHGTYVNSPTLGVGSGLVNDADTAAQFSAAASQHGDVPYDVRLDFTTAVSMSLLFKITSLPVTVNAKTLAARGGLGPNFLRIDTGTNVLQWYVQTGSGFEPHGEWPTIPNIGQWYHVVGTYDNRDGVNGRIILYVNGQQVDSRTRTGALVNNLIGFSFAAGESNYNGAIDEVAIWNRELSAAEVASLYSAATVPRTTIDTSGFIPSQLGLFKLAKPRKTRGENMQEIWDTEGADECDDLLNTWFGESYNVPAGSRYTGAMKTLIANAGLLDVLPDATDVTPIDFTWPPGTPVLTMLNDLAYGLNYWDVWAEVDGRISSRRRRWSLTNPPLSSSSLYTKLIQPDVTWSGGDDPKMILPPIVDEPDTTGRANCMRFITADPSRDILDAEARNVDPNSPSSTTNTPLRVQNLNADFVASAWNDGNSFVIPVVDLILEEAHSQEATLLTMFDPRRFAHETYRIIIPNEENNSRWYCFEWEVQLDVDGVMQHKIGRMTDPLYVTIVALLPL